MRISSEYTVTMSGEDVSKLLVMLQKMTGNMFLEICSETRYSVDDLQGVCMELINLLEGDD